MNEDDDEKPDFSKDFPKIDPDLKISQDEDHGHGEHSDVIQGIPGGTDQVRVNPDGTVQKGGTTRIGKTEIRR